MQPFVLPTAQQLLDSLEGVAYLVDPDGRILGCGRRNWDGFARENGGAAAVSDAIIGTFLLDHVGGDDVRTRYRGWLEAVATGREAGIVVPFRCDAPSVRREARLSIRPIYTDGGLAAILFHSLTISETVRLPLPLFDVTAMLEHVRADRRRIVSMCSFCHAVRRSESMDGTDSWIPVETYYREGGVTDVRISHGICPTCAPSLPDLHDA